MKKLLFVIVSVFVVASITGCGNTWDDVGDYDYYSDYDFDSDYNYDYDVNSDNKSDDDNSASYGGKSDFGESLAQFYEDDGEFVFREGYTHDRTMEAAEKYMETTYGKTISVEDSVVLLTSDINFYIAVGVTTEFDAYEVLVYHDSEANTWFGVYDEFYEE